MSQQERDQALEEVESLATEYTEARKHAESVRDRLDTAMLYAKSVGASFRQLARHSGRSVGFSQKSLARKGYETRQPSQED